MSTPQALAGLEHVASGKVRELYRVDAEHLLVVATDRISAFDHVLSTRIPGKGRVLTAMSFFWFELLADVSNHLAGSVDDPRIPEAVRGRAMLVRELPMLPVEAVARGFLTGSGLSEYHRTGAVCGVELPAGLVEASRLAEPVFTPATKAELGAHDENISFARCAELVGEQTAARVRERTLSIYRRALEHAMQRGMILADTKLEFGVGPDGELVLADEVLTPDSSRFWPAEGYSPGRSQPSFDKQLVRNWLLSEESGWDRQGGLAPPELPEHVVLSTGQRYRQAYELLTGRSFADWPGTDTAA